MAKSFLLVWSLLWLSLSALGNQQADLSLKRKQLQKVYSAEIGITEKTGRNDGEGPKKYLVYCGLSEGYEWCSAFVSWCFNQAKIKSLKTPWSPAWYDESRLVFRKGWDRPKYQPKAGDVVLYWVPYKKRIGHVGFFDKYGEQYCETVEGNTRLAGIQGVHRMKRYWTSFYAILNYCY